MHSIAAAAERRVGSQSPPVASAARAHASDARAALIGGQWEPTRIVSRQGRFVLYRARVAGELGPGCYVVKLPRNTVASGSAALAYLRREAAVCAAVNNPNLSSVLATGLDDGRPHVVLPYFDGISLRRLLDSVYRPSLEAQAAQRVVRRALAIVRQTAAALAALHGAGWLHGQVRPDHILVSPQGHATLIDLTQVCRLDGAEVAAACDALAAPRYCAPEQFRPGFVSAAADIYALGITLFELLRGQPPFVGASHCELARAHCTRRVPELLGVCLEVNELLQRMLAKEPLRRPPAAELVRWLAELEIHELAL